jgi:hypothetical protein
MYLSLSGEKKDTLGPDSLEEGALELYIYFKDLCPYI